MIIRPLHAPISTETTALHVYVIQFFSTFLALREHDFAEALKRYPERV